MLGFYSLGALLMLLWLIHRNKKNGFSETPEKEILRTNDGLEKGFRLVRRNPESIVPHVIIGGKFAVKNGQKTPQFGKERMGRLLRHKPRSDEKEGEKFEN